MDWLENSSRRANGLLLLLPELSDMVAFVVVLFGREYLYERAAGDLHEAENLYVVQRTYTKHRGLIRATVILKHERRNPSYTRHNPFLKLTPSTNLQVQP